MDKPRKSLSTRLAMGILVAAIPIFLLSLGILFWQSRNFIREEAAERANSVLNTALQRVKTYMNTVETATNSNEWLVTEDFRPERLLEVTSRILWLNRHVHGCSITAEPDMFPQYGRYFSAYSVRQKIKTDGQYEVFIPHTSREDAVGQLQNSFATMQESLNFHLGIIRYSTEVAQQRNEELVRATRLAEEALRQKTTFIQNVTHQIRTPLNIIMGFAQVLPESQALPKEEMASIKNMMQHNSNTLTRLVQMLFDSSDLGLSEELNSHKYELVSCNQVARESILYTQAHFPDITVNFETDAADDFCICTNALYLMRSLRELLYNSAKYSDGQHLSCCITHTDSTVKFCVEDIGPGISEEKIEQMFKPFTKIDDLTEGLGLGLPLAKQHAQSLGGDLTLDTSYTQGCRFVIELPVSRS